MDTALVIAFAVVAMADWAVISRDADRRITKTLATVVLVAIALVVGDMEGDARTVLIVAVVLCLAGDVFLLRDDDTSFLAGLGSFALGHGAYVVTALMIGVSWPRLAVAFPFLAVVLVLQTVTQMLPGAKRHGGTPMLVAVACYSAIISAMVITATGTSSWVAAAGAMLFATSDSIIGYTRFVKPVRQADLPIMVTYHAGQVLLILGLIAAG